LYISNLSSSVTETDLKTYFEKYGLINEIKIVKQRKLFGFSKSKTCNSNLNSLNCFITFDQPINALKAYQQLDNSIFQGKMIRIYPAIPQPQQNDTVVDNNQKISPSESFKQKRFKYLKQRSLDPLTWNALFTSQNTGLFFY
jgi:multiple RNA-binding domain-containing protein 1